MHKSMSVIFLIIMLFIPAIFLFKVMPWSLLWLFSYVAVIYFFLRKSSKEKTYYKGFSIIYVGAAVAVLGKSWVTGHASSEDVSSQEMVIESFFQVMLMTSSGLGGGLLAHYFINERKA
ncbi:hypothetical protein [Enterobacter sp.]|uniref:hypothetical protein n=1 Tax=Enterobacter sp. TaxID=42895 RepID=UPI0029817BDD|nr:hypothetical protein [Enterobacter sp.]